MAYTKTTWVDNSTPYINAANLGHIETGIKDAHDALDLKAPLASPTFTGTVSGVTKTHVGLANVDNTSDASKPISTLTQAALDLKATDTTVVKLTGAQTVAGIKTYSSSPIVPTPTTATQAANKDYVDTAVAAGGGGGGGGASSMDELTDVIISSPATAQVVRYNGTNWVNAALAKADVGLSNVDNTSDTTKNSATVTLTNKTMSGANNTFSAIPQSAVSTLVADLALKAPLASPTFTGTVSGVTKAHVGLSNVDNTSDASKPISGATQAALDDKLESSAAFSGSFSDLTGSFNGIVDIITTTTARVGLTVMVGYNDAGSAWPSVPTNLTTDSNVALHWVGGTEADPPPTSSGPALWDRPVV